MNQKIIAAVIFIGVFAVAGCESKQARVQNLEAKYDKLNAQYRNDCLGMGGSNSQGVNDALLGIPSNAATSPVMTPQQQAKCKAEKAKLDPLADELLKAQQP